MDKEKNAEWLFDGDIRKEFQKLVLSKLNYEIETAEERTQLVNTIFEEQEVKALIENYYSSPAFINKQIKTKNDFLSEKDFSLYSLQIIADYLIFPKPAKKEKPVIHSKRRIKKDSKRELPNGNLTEVHTKKYRVQTEIEITDQDKNENRFIFQLDKVICSLGKILGYGLENRADIKKQLIEKLGLKTVRSMEKLYAEKKKEIQTVKEQLSNMITFKRIANGSTEFNFEEDTGYYDENDDYILITENDIRINNKDHVLQLLNFYSALKESTYGDPSTDISILLFEIEKLIEDAELEDYKKDILIMKIDGLNGNEICEQIQLKYGLKFSETWISKVYNDEIPQRITDTYNQQYEDWLYTFKYRGNYKKCSKCGENKLATIKYFRKRKDNKGDGYYNNCRKCEK